jgi:hypothetical protein
MWSRTYKNVPREANEAIASVYHLFVDMVASSAIRRANVFEVLYKTERLDKEMGYRAAIICCRDSSSNSRCHSGTRGVS